MVRGLALMAAMIALGGCALFQGPKVRMIDTSTNTENRIETRAARGGPITLSGAVSPARVHLVEPQVTVMAPPTVVPSAPGGLLYAQWCSDCHGAQGHGNGPVAGQMPVKPRDLTTLSLNNGGSFPAASVMDAMQGGGAYHRGLQPEIGAAMDGGIVEWIAPNGLPMMTTQSTMNMIVYLESLQI